MPVTPSSRISSKKAAIAATNETGGTEKCMVTLPGNSAAPQLLQSAAKATIHHTAPSGRIVGGKNKHKKGKGFFRLQFLNCHVSASQCTDSRAQIIWDAAL